MIWIALSLAVLSSVVNILSNVNSISCNCYSMLSITGIPTDPPSSAIISINPNTLLVNNSYLYSSSICSLRFSPYTFNTKPITPPKTPTNPYNPSLPSMSDIRQPKAFSFISPLDTNLVFISSYTFICLLFSFLSSRSVYACFYSASSFNVFSRLS
jgi:hypothetical protein